MNIPDENKNGRQNSYPTKIKTELNTKFYFKVRDSQ